MSIKKPNKKNSSPKNKIADLKEKLAHHLPEFFDLALERYHLLITADKNLESSPDSGKQESQAKAILTHITLLIRLAEWVFDFNKKEKFLDEVEKNGEAPEDMVKTARKALIAFKQEKTSHGGEITSHGGEKTGGEKTGGEKTGGEKTGGKITGHE